MSARDSTTRKLLDLPYEILMKILSYVPHDDFRNVRLVNRRCNDLLYDSALWRKVDLVFPRKPEQISFMASTILPSIGEKLEELKITGFEGVHEDAFENEREPQTLSVAVLDKIKASCPGLKTLVLRRCRFDLEPAAQDNLPDTLETLELDYCRFTDLQDNSWTTEMMNDGPRQLLPNLVTLKVERSRVSMQWLRYLRARSPLRNLTVTKNTFVGHRALHQFLPPPPPPRNTGQVLKVLDLSGMQEYLEILVDEWLVSNLECKVTHLYMENVHFLPRSVPAHLQIEFISVAGYYPHSGGWFGEQEFADIDAWAKIPSMREINASGVRMNQVQRNYLVEKHPNVVFDLNEEISESPRLYF